MAEQRTHTQVLLDGQGPIWPPPGSGPLRFSFVDHGRTFLGRLVRVGERARLHIAGAIAELPYSVESPDRRARLLAAMRGAARPGLGRLSIGPRQTICVEGEISFEAPLTPARLIAAAAMFVRATRPAAERIARAVAPPAAADRRK